MPIRRAITFAAVLALNQNAPHVALEIIGTARNQNYVTVRNIKVEAFTALGRPEDALPILKSVLQVNDTNFKHTFTKDTVANLKKAVEKSGDNELVQSFNRLEKFLVENGNISDQTLSDMLTTEITVRDLPDNKDKSVLAASYNSNNSYNNDRYERRQNFGNRRPQQRRPGLEDLY